MIRNNLLMLMFMAIFLSFHVWADQDSIGFVKVRFGEADIISANGSLSAQPGMPLYLGNILKTGDDGSLGVTFVDNTLLSLGPNTEITVDEYLFAPAKGELKLAVRLARGTLHYISGVIAKLRPEAVSVTTPTGIIGVRGTRFLVKAEAE